jgi:hypothetical protein
MRLKQEEARRRLVLLLSCWVLAAAVLCSQSLVLSDNEQGWRASVLRTLAHRGEIGSGPSMTAALTPE